MKIYEIRKGIILKYFFRGRIRVVKYLEFLKGYIIFFLVYMYKRLGFRLYYCGIGVGSNLKRKFLFLVIFYI